MCGRYNVLTSAQGFVDLLSVLIEIDKKLEQGPRYNVAPTQPVLAVRRALSPDNAEMVMLRWGLIPFWAKDRTIGNRLINARSETAAVKPAFRQAFKKRRCLIAADGWYEWQKAQGHKQPYFIHRKDNLPFFFAGLWERWEGTDEHDEGVSVESCTILTCDAPEYLKFIHPRMPVALDQGLYEQWMDPSNTDSKHANEVLRQRPTNIFAAHPVSTYVNKPTNDSPQCIEPIDASL